MPKVSMNQGYLSSYLLDTTLGTGKFRRSEVSAPSAAYAAVFRQAL